MTIITIINQNNYCYSPSQCDNLILCCSIGQKHSLCFVVVTLIVQKIDIIPTQHYKEHRARLSCETNNRIYSHYLILRAILTNYHTI